MTKNWHWKVKIFKNIYVSSSIVSDENFLFIYLLVGSNFTVKGNIQDVTKVTGTITKQKHNNK